MPSPVVQEVSAPDDYGFLDSITAKMGQTSTVESEVDPAIRATPCSTSACQMRELRCSVLETSW